jgi:uncharacterized protein YycO
MAVPLYNKRKLEKLFERKDRDANLQNYLKIRSELKSGDLLFFSGDHWLSSMIRGRSRSAWSHCGIVVIIEEMNKIFLVESVLGNGVRMVPMSNVFKDYEGNQQPYVGRVAWARHGKLSLDKDKLRKVKEFCLDNLTKQYDNWEYVRILRRSFLGSKELFHDNKFTCSEFVWEAFKYAGIKLPKERGYFISPGAFWRQDEVEMKGVLI